MEPNSHQGPISAGDTHFRHVCMVAICFAVLLTACFNATNCFKVSAPSGEIVSAELQLCRKSMPLIQQGDSFNRQMAISCEGSGKIVVRLKDGNETSCPIGYVTFGLEDTFEYVIKDGACRSTMIKSTVGP
jgi:hypothetical protein